MTKNNILVVEKITWFNILLSAYLLRFADKIYLADSSPTGVLNGFWNFISRHKKIFILKDFSDPEALGKAGEISVKITECVFEEINKKNKSVVYSLVYFFNDENILSAYKQKLIFYVEQFLTVYFNSISLSRTNSPDSVFFLARDIGSFKIIKSILLEGGLKKDFVKLVDFPPLFWFLGSFLSFIYILFFSIYVIFSFIFLGGVHLNRSIKYFKIGCPNTFGVKTTGLFPNDAFFIDQKNFSKEDVLVLLKYEYKNSFILKEYSDVGIKTLDVNRISVPIKYFPNLFKKLFFTTKILCTSNDDFSNKIIMRLIYTGFKWDILMQSYRFDVVWSHDDRTNEDSVITTTINRYGGKHIFIPHFQMLKKGCQSAYFYYNLMILPGNFMKDAYSQTWSNDGVISISGIPSNDNLKLPNKNLSSGKLIDLIKKLKEKNKKLVAVFSGSYQGASHSVERYLKLFRACIKLIESNSDVCVLLRPKIKKEYFKAADLFQKEEFNKIVKYELNENFFILDSRDGYACSASYLIKVSDVVISMSGDGYPISSIWPEALMLGKPSFAYNPKFIELPLLHEFNGKLIFSEENDLITEVTCALNKKWKLKNKKRLKYLFDPFCDGCAVDRIRDNLKNEMIHNRLR